MDEDVHDDIVNFSMNFKVYPPYFSVIVVAKITVIIRFNVDLDVFGFHTNFLLIQLHHYSFLYQKLLAHVPPSLYPSIRFFYLVWLYCLARYYVQLC